MDFTAADLKKIRTEYGLTQSEFGKLLGYSSIQSASKNVSAMENNRQPIPKKVRYLLYIYWTSEIPRAIWEENIS